MSVKYLEHKRITRRDLAEFDEKFAPKLLEVIKHLAKTGLKLKRAA